MNETKYVLFNDINIVLYTVVINTFCACSDCRLQKARMQITTNKERRKLIQKTNKSVHTEDLNQIRTQ